MAFTPRVVIGMDCMVCKPTGRHSRVTAVDAAADQFVCYEHRTTSFRRHDMTEVLPAGTSINGQGNIKVSNNRITINTPGGPVVLTADPNVNLYPSMGWDLGGWEDQIAQKAAKKAAKTISEFPHTCLRCGQPAYCGWNDTSHLDGALDKTCR